MSVKLQGLLNVEQSSEVKSILCLILLFFSLSAIVQSDECQKSTDVSRGQQSTFTSDCVPIGQWQLSVAFGLGIRSNPLHGGDSIPLFVVPSISYYGEHFYFDDATIGYTFIDTAQLSMSMISNLNVQAANFTRWHPSNIFMPNSSLKSIGEIEFSDEMKNISGPAQRVNYDLVRRKWALDAGLQIHYFMANNWVVQASLLHDISGIYQGANGQLKIKKLMKWAQFRLKLYTGVNWQSRELANYYYGLSERDGVASDDVYQVGSSNNWFIGINANYQISKKWRAVLTLKSLQYGSSISNSPLLKDKHINTFFAGIAYDF